MSRARNPDGTFMSAEDAFLERQEAEWNAEIGRLMATGLSFDEAHIAAGGEIFADADNPAAIAEVRAAYEKVGRA